MRVARTARQELLCSSLPGNKDSRRVREEVGACEMGWNEIGRVG